MFCSRKIEGQKLRRTRLKNIYVNSVCLTALTAPKAWWNWTAEVSLKHKRKSFLTRAADDNLKTLKTKDNAEFKKNKKQKTKQEGGILLAIRFSKHF